jgi:Protein of unknown function (DUF1488)
VPANITFPDCYSMLHERRCLAFPALHAGRRLTCFVSYQILVTRFGARDASDEEVLAALLENRSRIRGLARDLIGRGRVTPQGEVLVV